MADKGVPGLAEALLAALPAPALLIGAQARIIAANDRAGALLGPGLIGRHHVTALRQPALLQAIERAGQGQGAEVARFHTTLDGQDRVYRATVAALATGDTLLVHFDDQSDFDAMDLMRRDFVANVSHELRTPLTALLGFIETLRGPARDDAAARDRFLATMEDEARRMNRLVGDLLSLSRVEADQRVRPAGRVDLAALAGSVLDRLRPLADEQGVTLATELAGGVAPVPGDEDQLRQVLVNLIENAIHHGGRAGRVTVGLEAPEPMAWLRGPGVTLWVADRGAGIAAHHVPRLTERFYRVDSHRSRRMGGTGLGLAIVKHIVTRHRGRLRVDSTPGHGSRFSVLLPVD